MSHLRFLIDGYILRTHTVGYVIWSLIAVLGKNIHSSGLTHNMKSMKKQKEEYQILPGEQEIKRRDHPFIK